MTTNKFALEGYIYMHRAVRNELAEMVARLETINQPNTLVARKIRIRFNLHCEVIEAHSVLEDQELFPLLARRDREFQLSLKELNGQHHNLHRHIKLINQQLQRLEATGLTTAGRQAGFGEVIRLFKAYRLAMLEHLDQEEAALIPAVMRHFTVEEQILLEKKCQLSPNSLKHAPRLVPWLIDNLNRKDRAVLYNSAPAPLRAVYQFTWKKNYDRLKAAALF